MKFEPDDYIFGFWYGEFQNDKGNVLITLVKRNNKFIGELRTRYYTPNDEDEKTFYNFDLNTDDEKTAIALCLETIGLMQLGSDLIGGLINFDLFEVRGDIKKFVELIKSNKCPHWMNVKMKKLEDIK